MAKNKQRNTVKIVGAGHGAMFTSIKRATILVNKGRAVWVGPTTIAFKNNTDFVAVKTGDNSPFRKRYDDVRIDGEFHWSPRPSAGFMVMQASHDL